MTRFLFAAASILLLNVVAVYSQATGFLSLRACPISHVYLVDVCHIYPKNASGGSQGTMSASAWTYNALGCPFGLLRSLFRFEQLSLIPSCAEILSAKLQLYGAGPNITYYREGAFSYYPGSPLNSFGSNEVHLLRVTEPWSINTVTWITQPSSTDPPVIIPPSTSNNNYNPPPLDVTSQVQKMVQLEQTSYGFLMKLPVEQYYRKMMFLSSLAEDVNNRPLLEVKYAVPCGCVYCTNKGE